MAHLVRCFPPLKTGFSVAMFSNTQGFHQKKNYSDFLQEQWTNDAAQAESDTDFGCWVSRITKPPSTTRERERDTGDGWSIAAIENGDLGMVYGMGLPHKQCTNNCWYAHMFMFIMNLAIPWYNPAMLPLGMESFEQKGIRKILGVTSPACCFHKIHSNPVRWTKPKITWFLNVFYTITSEKSKPFGMIIEGF